ncbi:hypothetical protein EDB83DRAFT_2312632 [Lactarius deliciosus]|nr:hypothetical protein EDB83DRAFT_2312632 [Lactarius deliciosus]
MALEMIRLGSGYLAMGHVLGLELQASSFKYSKLQLPTKLPTAPQYMQSVWYGTVSAQRLGIWSYKNSTSSSNKHIDSQVFTCRGITLTLALTSANFILFLIHVHIGEFARPLPARAKGNDFVQRDARAVRTDMVHPSATR